MSEVKRYDIYSDGFDNFSISEDEAGRYVSLEDYTALQQQLNAVVAENASMRSAIDQTIGWQESVDAENVESVRMLAELKTPNTNAILNAVRAEGVEMFADERDELRKLYVADKNREMTIAADHCSMVARHFADQLRGDAAENG